MFRIAWLYLKWIFSASSLRDDAEESRIAGWCLLNKPGFRLPATAGSDLFIVFRQWKSAVTSRPFVPLPEIHPEALPGENDWVYDNRAVTKDLRCDHVRYSIGRHPAFFAARDQVRGMPGCSHFSDLIVLTGLLPWFFIWSLFSSRRAAIAMLLVEMREAAALMRLASLMKVKQVYFYCPFEKDANALYLLMKEKGIRVLKIPSPSLLAIHHRQLLTDTLVLTSPYQEDELSAYARHIRYREIMRWVPELYLTYAAHYESWKEPRRNTIGYYSHATWLRLEMNHGKGADGDLDAELLFLPVLASVLKKHPQFRLSIFLHPKEKKYQPFEKVRSYYESVFSDISFDFADDKRSSTLQFEAVETGVGAISTILFERLFSGYKTLMYPVGVPGFPLDSSGLKKACAFNAEELERLLLDSFGEDESTYFKRTGLGAYTARYWLQKDHA